MKRILFISVILLTGLLARGQTSTVPDGYQVFKYPNGTVSSEGVLKNGKPDGSGTYISQNGDIYEGEFR